MSVAAQIEKIDQELFLFLNGLHNSFFDPVMEFCSHRASWIPFYAILLYLIWKLHKKRTWVHVVSVSVCILLSDKFSVYIKNAVKRYRPCHNLDLVHQVHLVDGCGGQFGFVSSHAANTFALAFLVTWFLKKQYRRIDIIMFSWAVIVSYSRIYLGKHYPLDIIGGAIVGLLAAGIALYVHKVINSKFYGVKSDQIQ